MQRLIETSQWGDDLTAIGQQITNHSAFQSSIQRSVEVDRARAELVSTHTHYIYIRSKDDRIISDLILSEVLRDV